MIRETSFKVKGVLGPHPPVSDDWNPNLSAATFEDVVFVPFRTGAEKLYPGSSLGAISIRVRDIDEIEDTISAISEVLKHKHGREGFFVIAR